jgi:hypothetical protein
VTECTCRGKSRCGLGENAQFAGWAGACYAGRVLDPEALTKLQCAILSRLHSEYPGHKGLVKLFTNQPLDDEWAFEELKRLQDSDIEALRIIPRESDDNAGNVKECPYTTAEGTELCWRCQPHHCVTHRMDTAQQRSPAKCFADQTLF